jgi:hypothetical protein
VEKIENFNLENYIERYFHFICSVKENSTYPELDNFIEEEFLLFNNIYTAAGEEFRSNLKLKEILINHQYHSHLFLLLNFLAFTLSAPFCMITQLLNR